MLFSTLIFKIKIRAYSGTYGKKIEVLGSVLFKTKDKNVFSIGDNVQINSKLTSNSTCVLTKTSFQSLNGGKITIGNNTGLTSTIMSARKSITIGENVLIGANCMIFDHDFHQMNYLMRRENNSTEISTEPVVIEDDVFIGVNSIILKGVHIGKRTVVAAGSVIFKKYIPPDSIIAGNPANSVKRLVKINED